MGRARAGILDGARRCLADAGPRGLTMSGIADRGGVAKATVYNHFRDRAEVVSGLAVDDVEQLAAVAADAPDLAAALGAVGVAAAGLPELRGALRHDPSVAAAVTTPADTPAWAAARAAVSELLERHVDGSSAATVALTLRWIGAIAVAAPADDEVHAEARLLTLALGPPSPPPPPPGP